MKYKTNLRLNNTRCSIDFTTEKEKKERNLSSSPISYRGTPTPIRATISTRRNEGRKEGSVKESGT